MKSKSNSCPLTSTIIEMATLTLPESKSSSSLTNGSSNNQSPIPSLKISSIGNQQSKSDEPAKVSEWFDTDSHRTFMKTVRSGDIVELRNSRMSHWGIIVRLRQPPSPNGRKSEPDEVMVYHLIHSQLHRGQVGQFTIEEFWQPDCRIRINNTTNGMSLYGKSRTIPKADLLDNAFTAHMSTTLKWQTCCDFIRWTCDEDTHNLMSKSIHSIKENHKS